MKRIAVVAAVSAALLCRCFASDATEVFATNVDAGSPATDLRWEVYLPSSGGPTFNAVVVIHGGQYKGSSRGPPSASQDLANAGFVVFAVEYRLAPPHTEMTNARPPGDPQADPPSDGRPPEQTDDIQRAIRAARSPAATSVAFGKTNGKVAVVGFSCGGAHGAWWLLSGTANDDRPDALVTCSGTFDLDNSDFLANTQAKGDIENYINHALGEGTPFHTAAKAASPYWLTITATPPPWLGFNSDNEIVAQSVHSNMVTKMTAGGGTVESHLRSGSQHASAYWYLDCGPGCSFSTVKDSTIDFLQRMLSITPTQPVTAPQILLRQ